MKVRLFTQAKSILAVSIFSILFAGCTQDENTVTNDYQTENPIDGAVAPNGFLFSTTTAVQIEVTVDDKFNGQYAYMVRIFDKNPLVKDNLTNLLSAGTARLNQPYTSEICLPTTTGFIYIEQTDPKGRSIIREYPVAESVSCDFSSTAVAQNASQRLRSASAVNSGISEPFYTSVPENAIEISVTPTQSIQSNTAYKISQNLNGTFTHWGCSNSKLFVTATWTIPSNFTVEDGLEIIVMNGGKIIAENGTLSFNGSTTKLEVMPGGTVDIKALSLSNNNAIYNMGAFRASSLLNNPGLIYNGAEGTMTVSDMSIGGASVINNGILNANNFVSTWGTELENNCTMNITNTFTFQGGAITLNQGSIVAQEINLNNNSGNNLIRMNNGSMLKGITSINFNSNVTITANGNTSLVKSPEMYCSSNVVFNGELMIESDNLSGLYSNNIWWKPYTVNSPAQMAPYDNSDVTIMVCTGTVNEGNPGTAPDDPHYPVTVKDESNYTYSFEDNWPLYGDYDMNDLVFKVTNKELKLDENNEVTGFSIQLEILAVGASKKIAAALQLDNVPASAITQAVTYNQKPSSLFEFTSMNLEAKQSKAVIPLFAEAHQLMGNDGTGLINTYHNSPANVSENPVVTISLTFTNSGLVASDFNNDKLNFFIITDEKSSNRKETHLSGFKPTNLANINYFGLYDDNTSASSSRYYLSNDNLTWGIKVPGDFHYPLEGKSITEAYPGFVNWLTSGGLETDDWYNTYNEDKVY